MKPDNIDYTYVTRMIDGEATRMDKIKPHVMERIEALGRMNDRRQAYLSAGDREGLLALAREYEAMRMQRMAKKLRIEADVL